MWCHPDPSEQPVPGSDPLPSCSTTTGLCDRCGSIIKRGSQVEIDRYLQSHLLLGVFPTPSFPDNDHEILPSAKADAVYQEYGALLAKLHGMRWSTIPRAVVETSGHFLANAFERRPFGHGHFAVVIGMGPPNASHAALQMRGLGSARCSVRAWSLGSAAVTVETATTDGALGISVAGIVRGLAVLHIYATESPPM